MGALNTAALDDIVAKIHGNNNGNPEQLFIYKDDRTGANALPTAVVGKWSSMFTQNGVGAVTGSAPGTTPRQCTNSTAGACYLTDASGGRDKYIVGASGHSVQQGTLIVYDRLADVSGLDATNTGVQTFAASASLTPSRNTGGKGNQIWLEVYTAIGSATNIVVNYTNENGTSGRTTPNVRFGASGFAEALRIMKCPLQAGDLGVQSVQSVQLASSTGTVGDFGVTLARPLFMIPLLTVGAATIRDLLLAPPNICKIEAGACVAFAFCPTVTAGNGHVFGHLQTVEV